MLLNRCFTYEGHVHQLLIASDDHGWDVIEAQDSHVVVHVHRHDWHRVEGDLRRFQMRAPEIANDGSTESRGARLSPQSVRSAS